MHVTDEAKEEIDDALVGDDTATVEQVKESIVRLIASALRIEVSIGQRGVSRVVFTARCHAGGHHALCLRKLQRFEIEMQSVIKKQWVGCSATIMCTSPAWCNTSTDGILLTDLERAMESGATAITVNNIVVPVVELGVQPVRQHTQVRLPEGVPSPPAAGGSTDGHADDGNPSPTQRRRRRRKKEKLNEPEPELDEPALEQDEPEPEPETSPS